MQPYVEQLHITVDAAVPLLLALGSASARRPQPGTWSPREIIGHLIDSASNNHQRFVRAQFQRHLVFNGYEQDAWVSSQSYQTADWTNLVLLWASFNRHLAHVMTTIPEAVRQAAHREHNLDRLAYKPVPAGEPATLDYFMADYVAHLQHHLVQVFGPDWRSRG